MRCEYCREDTRNRGTRLIETHCHVTSDGEYLEVSPLQACSARALYLTTIKTSPLLPGRASTLTSPYLDSGERSDVPRDPHSCAAIDETFPKPLLCVQCVCLHGAREYPAYDPFRAVVYLAIPPVRARPNYRHYSRAPAPHVEDRYFFSGRISVMPSDCTGTIPDSDTVQPVLSRALHRIS